MKNHAVSTVSLVLASLPAVAQHQAWIRRSGTDVPQGARRAVALRQSALTFTVEFARLIH